MRIMHTDNFGGDYPNERFVEGLPSLNRERMQRICDAINHGMPPGSPRYYRVVEDDYALKPGFEP